MFHGEWQKLLTYYLMLILLSYHSAESIFRLKCTIVSNNHYYDLTETINCMKNHLRYGRGGKCYITFKF